MRKTQYCGVLFAGCPASFTYNASVNGCYRVMTSNLDWTAAGQECQSLDAHLVIINSAAEQAAIEEMFNNTSRQCPFSPFLIYHLAVSVRFNAKSMRA